MYYFSVFDHAAPEWWTITVVITHAIRLSIVKPKTNVIIVLANFKQCRQFNASEEKHLRTSHNQFAFPLDFLNHLMLYTRPKQILITFDTHMKKYSYYKSAVPFLLTVVQSSLLFSDAPLNV